MVIAVFGDCMVLILSLFGLWALVIWVLRLGCGSSLLVTLWLLVFGLCVLVSVFKCLLIWGFMVG